MHKNSLLALGLVLSLMISGCAKKADTTLSQGTGFDSISTTDELAQLPPVSSSIPTAVEALPVETSPVTQGVPMVATPAMPFPAEEVISSLSQDKKIQTALKNAGYYQGNVDGKIGPASKKAIEAFQRDKGLKVDGKVGPKTWTALEAYLTGNAQGVLVENSGAPVVQ